MPEEPYLIPLGKADIKKTGRDVTVIATMHMVGVALTAALRLEEEGISVEVIDPRSLKPLDEETILASVRKTNRLVVAHEACIGNATGCRLGSRGLSCGTAEALGITDTVDEKAGP